jgi:hypothetical protein
MRLSQAFQAERRIRNESLADLAPADHGFAIYDGLRAAPDNVGAARFVASKPLDVSIALCWA